MIYKTRKKRKRSHNKFRIENLWLATRGISKPLKIESEMTKRGRKLVIIAL
mgnify:CR=1